MDRALMDRSAVISRYTPAHFQPTSRAGDNRMRVFSRIRAALVAAFTLISLLWWVAGGASDLSTLNPGIKQARAEGQASQLVQLLLQRGEHFRTSGFLRNAQPDIREAVDVSSELDNAALKALSLSALGQLYATPVGNAALIVDWSDPGPLFSESITLADDSGEAALISLVRARAGAWQQQQGELEQALANYSQSHEAASRVSNRILQTQALTGMARAQAALKQEAMALSSLQQAANAGKGLSADAQVSSNLMLIEIARELPGGGNLWAETLEANDGLKEELSDSRLLASHYAEMGRWFEVAKETDVSLDYTELAIRTAPEAHDLAFDWEWRLGRLFEQQDNPLAAINAYRRAARHVEAIRQDIPVTYSEGRSSFRETLAPIFLRLADLLMQQADRETSTGEVQSLLVESQDIVERLKSSELQDYFRNVCVVNQTQSLSDDTLQETAVLYPILLPERLALLVKVDSGYHHVTVPISSQEIDRTVDRLVENLLNPNSRNAYRRDAEKLYGWLVKPVEKLLEESEVSTLFFVPDGSLRRVPLSALWDGSQHLVERYAIASAPGLTLLNAEPFSELETDTLLAGVSNPGKVLDEVDPEIVAGFIEGYRQRQSRGLIKRNITAKPNAAEATQTEAAPPGIDERQKAFQLPAVKDEIETLASEVPSTLLLDENFALDRFRAEVTEGSHQVVHIASHGYFGGTAKDSWLMAHDELLDMNELSQLLKPKEFANQPIELLILSACQTAEGNDRAPLGLSGVALTSGARSVLGTLWVVADEATSELMQTFYAQLGSANNTKAEALRQAPLTTLSVDKFRHPFYWAPFVLIGSWL